MKHLVPFFLAVACTASPAMAHPGHLAEAAGHGHWLAAAALGAAAAIGLWAAIRGAKSKDEPAEEDIEAVDEEVEAETV